MRRATSLIGLLIVFALTFSTQASAQWSIGQPGTREPRAGQNRYVYLVMSDPLPGKEWDFNDGYQNVHMGDLVQLPGWIGAQRFRLVPVSPRETKPLYRRGNLIIWDQEGDDLAMLQSESRNAIAGGKSRLIPGFDYSPDGPVSVTYQVIGPRTSRPDGRKPFIPEFSDNKTPRPNRYIKLDFVEADTGVPDAAFEASLATHVNEVLALPGWMAAQRFRLPALLPGVTVPRLTFTKYLVVWETEGTNAQDLQNTIADAVKTGKVKAVAADKEKAQYSWWVTTSPHIDKDDFLR
jgi:hypothetical protein